MRHAPLIVLLAAALSLHGCSESQPEAKAKPGAKPESTAPAAKAPANNAERLQQCDAALRNAAAWLLKQPAEDGSFGKHAPVGVTGLVLTALLSSPDRAAMLKDPVVTKAAAYIVSMQQPDGSINEPGKKGLANYQTSAALAALVRIGDPAYQDAIQKAKTYLADTQRSDGLNAGGWGYNTTKRADLSNTQMTLDALKAAGLDENSEAFKNCLTFLQRCQNNSEVNDQPYSGNDGGAMYYPGVSKAGKVTLPNGKVVHQSYGSMTYALLRCYLIVGLKPTDPRVVAAQKWLAEHYTLNENPGMKKQGLYYYYMTMAEALALLGSPVLEGPEGETHRWAADLADALLARQAKDGTWVNPEMRWMENDPLLATSYAMLALRRCRDLLAP
ncbi:hypothetical protein HQ576_13710 [bacterium]|nr:hypothetical protein [bacterium]